jgi:outer membrane protein OmpA-like peptidoglycan-associated protein
MFANARSSDACRHCYSRRQSGSDAPPETLAWPVDTEALQTVGDALQAGDSLRCTLTVTAKNGLQSHKQFTVPAELIEQPFEVSRLSLIVFDFDRAEIGEQNRRMVSSFVAGSIADNSTSTITGSTDRLGEVEHNQKLSESRALAVRDLVLAERANTNIASTRGIGPSSLPYDNDLPEGRYYCRTVAVEVKTPIVHGAAR